jgi:hypothetical protein
MRLVTNELRIKPMLFHPFSCKGHSITKPSRFDDYDFKIFIIIMKFHVIINLGMTCKVHFFILIIFKTKL